MSTSDRLRVRDEQGGGLLANVRITQESAGTRTFGAWLGRQEAEDGGLGAEGLAALGANRATHIAGRMNRMLAALMPRRLATTMYRSLSAQILAKRSGEAGAGEPPA